MKNALQDSSEQGWEHWDKDTVPGGINEGL